MQQDGVFCTHETKKIRRLHKVQIQKITFIISNALSAFNQFCYYPLETMCPVISSSIERVNYGRSGADVPKPACKIRHSKDVLCDNCFSKLILLTPTS